MLSVMARRRGRSAGRSPPLYGGRDARVETCLTMLQFVRAAGARVVDRVGQPLHFDADSTCGSRRCRGTPALTGGGALA
jgi:hypothetical protein